ncbi:MAG: ATP-binding cassette domain-containing protein [Actinobacteria bacterium]|nr:ATP-binding cassette domain-containing protein [Actinomycetota bacterium]
MLNIRFEAELDYLTLKAEIVSGNEIIVISGPSGSGKTTLLKCIAGLMTPKEGFIAVDDRVLFSSVDSINMPARERRVGFVFQDFALFPHMTVERNVRYGISSDGISDDVGISKMLEAMNIAHLRKRFPGQLSAGEKQRVALLRALVAEPDLLLLDEPLSALDVDTRLALQTGLKDIQHMRDIPFVLVTHDFDEALRLGDGMAELKVEDHEHRFAYYGSRKHRKSHPFRVISGGVG